jgi:F-type H+-transporting ATPase subunit b
MNPMLKRKLLFVLLIAFVFISLGPVFAAEEHAAEAAAEHGETLLQTIGKWVNFFALVAILYLFLTRSIRIQDKFRAESDEIRKSIESARQAKEEAEKHLQELDQRMSQMNEDVARIKADAAREAEEEKKRILESAQKEAQRIVELAHREIDSEVRQARKELRKQVADIAVTQGRQIIQEEINDQDHKELVNRYIEELGK